MIGNNSRNWLLVSFTFFLLALFFLITLFFRFGDVFFGGSKGKPVGARTPAGFSRNRAEDVLAGYIDAYRKGKAEELVSLYSQSYLRKEGLNYQAATDEIRDYFKMVEERNGKIVRWDIIQFKVYSNYALAVCRLKRERGRQSTSVIVLEKEGLEWKVADVFRLRK